MIDHTGHPHPATPKARALCRANGGTGSIVKTGTKAPEVSAKAKAASPTVKKQPTVSAPKAPTIKKAPATTTHTTKTTGEPVKAGPNDSFKDFHERAAARKAAREKADNDARLARIRAAGNAALKAENDRTKPEITVKAQVKHRVDRVLDTQSKVVGDKISRIRSVDSKLPSVDSAEGRSQGIHAGTMAICTTHGDIHLHEHLHEREAMIKQAVDSGWFSKVGNEPIDGVIAHEMGHAFLSNFRMSSTHRRRVVDALVEHFGLTDSYGKAATYNSSMGDGLIKDSKTNRDKIRRGISKYAASNFDEMMAEVWAEYTMNPKPRPRIKKVGDVLKGIIAEGPNR